MKRFHVHVAVRDLDQAARFYSALLGAEPVVVKPDYVKWMVDDPAVNFAISARGAPLGVNHLGLQFDSDEDLLEVEDRLDAAGVVGVPDREAVCCYAKSDKYWVMDPAGLAWEQFHTTGATEEFGEELGRAERCGAGTCCGPVTASAAGGDAPQPGNSGCC